MIQPLTRQQAEIAGMLLVAGAILFKDRSPDGKGFRIKLHETQPDAPLSPYYLNLRTADNPKPGPLTPAHLEKIGDALFEMCQRDGVQLLTIGGIPNAGDPFADALAAASRRHGITTRVIRSSKINDGEGRRHIEGPAPGALRTGEWVTGVDDLITGAHSKIEWMTEVQRLGGKVGHVVVLVDRQQGGREDLEEHSVMLHAFLRIEDMFCYYGDFGLVDRLLIAESLRYLAIQILQS